jgi:predicted nicotinamide N-methyase
MVSNKKSSFSFSSSKMTTTSKSSSASSSSSAAAGGGSEENRPRNFLVTDATKSFHFSFFQYGKPVRITVDQTPDEDVWPGGALWDIGVLLSHFLVALAGFQPSTDGKETIEPPIRLLSVIPSVKDLTVLELGCGVGLTGIVAAAVLGTQLTIVTDLDVVVEKVTKPNCVLNTTTLAATKLQQQQKPYRLTKAGKRGRIMALPLCWGNTADEDIVLESFRKWTNKQEKSRTTKQQRKDGSLLSPSNPRDSGQPDLLIIGDVAYQHRPGAPSHFDALLSTVLRFLGPHTYVIFGTRMRMPASADLLDMLHEHMEEVTTHPIRADDIDPIFSKYKHQITIHVMKKRISAQT